MGSFPSWLRRLTVNKLAIATACSNHAYPIHEFSPPSFTKSESKKDLESMRPRARQSKSQPMTQREHKYRC